MRFTDDARALLERLEGCRMTAYPDQAGIWTIGYGHTGPEVVPGLSWTQEHCDQALIDDLSKFIPGVLRLVGQLPLGDNQFSALVILAFNIGLAAFSASTVLHRVQTGEISNVASAFMMWNKIHDPHTGQLVVSSGLVKRRQAEIDLWSTLD